MLLLPGTHGTSKSRAELIKGEGFKPSAGVRGTGAYFWRDTCFGEDLALSWHKKCFDEKRYQEDVKKSCCVIKATIEVEEDNFYNIDEAEVKDNVLLLFKAKGAPSSVKAVAKLYDKIIASLEQKISRTIAVVQAAVNVPPCQSFPKLYVNTADSYIVIDPECITINSITCYNERYTPCGTLN